MSEYSSLKKDLIERAENYNPVSNESLFFKSVFPISDEVLNSSIIAWILRLNDGEKYWLLNSLLRRVDSEHVQEYIDRVPNQIITEKITKSGKIADIIIRWDKFTLIIENKTKSKEHDSQCETYLKDNFSDKSEAYLIYLTIKGEPPKSLNRPESEFKDRFTTLSYSDLIICLNEIKGDINYMQDDSKKSFHEKIVEDYLLSLQYLTKRLVVYDKKGIKMKKIDEDVFWLINNKDKLTKFLNYARQSTHDFITEFLGCIENEIRVSEKYSELKCTVDPFVRFFYKKDWVKKTNIFYNNKEVEILIGYEIQIGGNATKPNKENFQIIGEEGRYIDIAIRLRAPLIDGKVNLEEDESEDFTLIKNIIMKKIRKHTSKKSKPASYNAYVERSDMAFSNNEEMDKWVKDRCKKFTTLIDDTYKKIDCNIEDILK